MLTIEHNLQDLLASLQVAPERVLRAQVQAMNDVAFDVRTEWQDEMRRKFDRVTPYVLRSIWVQRAALGRVEATIYPQYMGGKGVDPAKVLMAQVKGGARRSKRFERALQTAGILPAGMAAVPGSGLDAGQMDAYGNVKGSFIVQLLSYLQAFGEQGYRANMTAKRRNSLAKRGTTERGHATIGGVEYFVSQGPGERNGRRQHLAAGIWSRRGIHGSDVRPVFLFTRRMPGYTKTIDLKQIGERVVRAKYSPAFSKRLGRVLK